MPKYLQCELYLDLNVIDCAFSFHRVDFSTDILHHCAELTVVMFILRQYIEDQHVDIAVKQLCTYVIYVEQK